MPTSGCSSYRTRSTPRSVSRTKCASAGLDHSAGEARAGVAGGLRLVVVRVGVDDQAAADDVARPLADGDRVHGRVELGAAALVGLERRQVAGMALGRLGVAMRLAVRVEVSLGAHAVARAAVAGLVDVETVFRIGLEPLGKDDHAHLVADLLEGRLAEGLAALGWLQCSSRARRLVRGRLAA